MTSARDCRNCCCDPTFRENAERWAIPEWNDPVTPKTLPLLRLYYVRVGFLASGYVNQVGAPADEPAARFAGPTAVPRV